VRRMGLVVLSALVAGIVVGEAVRSHAPQLAGATDVVEAIGGLWLNALRMTVVPLVVSLLVTGIAAVSDTARAGGLVARAITLFTALIFFAAVFGIVATKLLLGAWPFSGDAAASLIASVGADAIEIAEPPTFVSWVQGLAPVNPVSAAASDSILQLVVFAVFFGFAATRLETSLRDPIVTFFRAVAEAMIVVVRWVLVAAPVGVFALALGVGARAGIGAAGVLAQYAVVVSAATLGITLVAWLLAVTWGGQPAGRFTAAMTPVWAIAASTQSSLASLPAMLDASLRGLRIAPHVADVVLPLAVALFRFTSPVANLAVCFIIAHLYGLEPTLLQIFGAVFVAFGVSVGSVGLPGQVSFVASIAPICMALGVPFELLGILLAVEIIPDVFRTLGNVTADVATTAILNRNGNPKAP